MPKIKILFYAIHHSFRDLTRKAFRCIINFGIDFLVCCGKHPRFLCMRSGAFIFLPEIQELSFVPIRLPLFPFRRQVFSARSKSRAKKRRLCVPNLTFRVETWFTSSLYVYYITILSSCQCVKCPKI